METWAWQEGSCQEFRLMVGIYYPGSKKNASALGSCCHIGFPEIMSDLKPRDIL